MRKFLSFILAFCLIFAVVAFPIIADTSYEEEFAYYHESRFWDPENPGDELVNRTRIHVSGSFFETYYRVYHRPVFGSGTASSVRGTLVSHANFTGQWTTPNQTFPIGDGVRGGFYARPNGNANNMHNGFTFIEINVAELAATDNGVDVLIATSNQSGGNTPNAGWNTPVLDGTYSYNVRIVDGQLVVAVNGFDYGSWGATVTSNLASWGNNPNSAIRHQRNGSLNLGNVSGTIFMFFHGQNLTFYSAGSGVVIGCEFYRSESFEQNVGAYNIDHMVVVVDQYGNESYFGSFGDGPLPLDESIYEGYHYFTVKLVVQGHVVAQHHVLVSVVRISNELRVASLIYGHMIDFGHIYTGTAPDIVICDWC